MDHPCLDGDPESDRIGCTKFNEGCTKFCEGCTKGSKVRFEVGIDPQTLPYGFQNEIMYHPCSTRVPEAIGSDVPNFVEDVRWVPNCVPRWGLTPNHFLMGF